MVDFGNDIAESVKTLAAGGVLLYPTDTVWGLGCDARNEDAVGQVFAIKHRPPEKSLIVMLGDARDVGIYVETLPPGIEGILQTFQTPVTVIYEGARNLPDSVIHPNGSIAIRVTNDPFCRELIQKFGGPIISTSANISGVPTPGLFNEISPEIIHAVSYAVGYRQEDMIPRTPSAIIRIGQDGQIISIR